MKPRLSPRSLTLPKSTLGLSLRLPRTARIIRYLLGTLLLLGMALVIFISYRSIEREQERSLQEKLEALVLVRSQSAQLWLEEQRELTLKLARLLSEIPAQSTNATSLPAAPGEELSPFLQAGLLADYCIFDPRGVLLSSAPQHLDFSLAFSSQHFAQAQKHGVALSFSSHHAPAEPPALFTLTPLRTDGFNGYLALRIPSQLSSLGLKTVRWGRSGKTFVLSESGAFLGEPSSEELTRLLPALAWSRWMSDPPTTPHIDLTHEFFDEETVGALLWLPQERVGVVTRVDRWEAFEFLFLLRSIFVVLATLLAGGLFGFLILGRWTLKIRQESLLVSQRLGRLARAIQPLSAALEHDPGAVVLVDDTGIIAYANSATRRIFNSNGPFIGKPAYTLFEQAHEELREALSSGLEAIVTQDSTSGEDEILLVASRPLKIEGKRHWMYTLRPVTREVRRQEVEHWKKLIRVLSHEINNSLAPITSLVSSGRKLNDLHFHDQRLETILSTIADRTTHLVSFLDSYRSIARLPRPTPQHVPWRPFLESLRTQKNFLLHEPLPESPGYFDPIQLERVLINTLDNAVEAGSPPEQIEVRVIPLETGIRLEIADRGHGMPENILRQAMLPFFSTKPSGTGVGLALSREIVEAHGGQMILSNREGGGLLVSVLLPSHCPQWVTDRSEPGEVAIPSSARLFAPPSTPRSGFR